MVAAICSARSLLLTSAFLATMPPQNAAAKAPLIGRAANDVGSSGAFRIPGQP